MYRYIIRGKVANLCTGKPHNPFRTHNINSTYSYPYIYTYIYIRCCIYVFWMNTQWESCFSQALYPLFITTYCSFWLPVSVSFPAKPADLGTLKQQKLCGSLSRAPWESHMRQCGHSHWSQMNWARLFCHLLVSIKKNIMWTDSLFALEVHTEGRK